MTHRETPIELPLCVRAESGATSPLCCLRGTLHCVVRTAIISVTHDLDDPFANCRERP